MRFLTRKHLLIVTMMVIPVAFQACAGSHKQLADPLMIVVPPEPVIVESDTPPDPLAYSHFLLGIQEEKAGNSPRAIAHFMAVLKRQPTAREARTHLFRLLMQIGRIGEAFDMLGDASALASYPPEKLFLFGRLFAWRGETKHVRSVISGLSEDGNMKNQKRELEGLLALLEGDSVRARDRLHEALGSGDRMWAGLFLGRLYEAQRDWKKAEEVYLSVLDIRKDFAPAQYRLALVFLRMHKQRMADQELAGLDRIGPYGLDAMLLRIRLALDGTFQPRQLQIGDVFPGTAAEIAQQAFTFWIEENPLLATNQMLLARQRNPDTPVANLVLGVIARQQGQYKQALKQFLLLASQNGPLQDDAIREWIDMVSGSEEAESVAQTYLAGLTAPVLPEWKVRMAARLANRLNLPADPIGFWQQVSKNHPSAETLYQYAMQLEIANRHAEALKVCEQLIQRFPNHTEALNFVGYSWAEQGRKLDQAATYLATAIRQKPWAAYIQDSLAWLYYQQGQYRQAETWIKFAIEYSSPDALIFEHYGDILQARNQSSVALDVYQRALRLNPESSQKDSLQKKIARLLNDRP